MTHFYLSLIIRSNFSDQIRSFKYNKLKTIFISTSQSSFTFFLLIIFLRITIRVFDLIIQARLLVDATFNSSRGDFSEINPNRKVKEQTAPTQSKSDVFVVLEIEYNINLRVIHQRQRRNHAYIANEQHKCKGKLSSVESD